MKPLTYSEQIIRMPDKSDKFDLRLRIVKHALEYGVKPTARLFNTTPKTVRKWLERYRQERCTGLNELPRIPQSCPHKTPPTLQARIAELRRQYPFMGSKRLKKEHNLPCRHDAIRRILREYGLIEKRHKKHKRNKYLANIKKTSMLFRHITLETMDFNDINHYWTKMKLLPMTIEQLTEREIRSALMFMGFDNQQNDE
jgi:transposase-like protein